MLSLGSCSDLKSNADTLKAESQTQIGILSELLVLDDATSVKPFANLMRLTY